MADELRPAAFIDRDGVLNVERGHVHRIEDFELLPGVAQSLRQLNTMGYALVVVTNQAGIAKGMYGPDDYEKLTAHLRAVFARDGVHFAGIYHCPHHPAGRVPAYARHCDCRKPAPGMLLRAAADLRLHLSRSIIVGDKVSDIAAGRAAGVRWAILVESGHDLPLDTGGLADFRCPGLAQASQWVADQHQRAC